jgi:hypothetical protein
MRSKSQAKSYLTQVHVFHAIPRWASVGGPCTISMYTLEVWYGIIQLGDPRSYYVCGTPWISYVPIHNQNCSPGLSDQSLINTGEGYHLQSFELDSIPLPYLPIWYSPLSPKCPLGLILVPQSDHFTYSTYDLHQKKWPYCKQFLTTRFLLIA